MSQRPKLAYIDLLNWKGLYTKSNPEVITAEMLTVAENCDYFEVYGGISKFRGSARVLDTIYKETTAQKIPWIGMYKASDLDGQILRQVLVAAGTKLFRLSGTNLATSSTTLETGRTADLFHDSDQLGQFLYLTNYDPDLVGKGNDLVKYDGSVTSKWGLTAPGGQETLREAFDDATDWDIDANCTVSDDTTTTWDGASIKVDKTGTTSASFYIQKELDAPFSPIGDGRPLAHAIADRVNFKLYIPRGTLVENFATSGPAMSVHVGTARLQEYYRFDYEIGSLNEGWQQVNLDFTDGDPHTPPTTTYPTLGDFYFFHPASDDIDTVKFEFNLASPSKTISGIRLDSLTSLDEGSPVVSPDQRGAGDFTGVYKYKVAFVSKYGNLSNAGPASVAATGSSTDSFYLNNLPVSSDTQIVERRLYRTVAGGSIYLFLDQIFDNVTTSYTDVIADGSLGSETPPQAADFSDDNSVPPKGGIVTTWKRTVFMAGDPQNPETLYFSEDDEPESFPLVNTFDLDEKITAIYETYSGLVVETETSKWQILGDNPDFSIDKVIKGVGCVGRRAAGTSRTEGWAVDRDGMRLYDLNEAVKISEPIRDKYETLNKANIELMHTAHFKPKNLIVESNADSSAEYTSTFGYIYMIDNVKNGSWTNIVTPTDANLNFLHMAEIEDSNGDSHLYAGGDDGMIYDLFLSSSKNWVDASGDPHAMDTNFSSPYLRPGELGIEVDGVGGKVDVTAIEVRTSGDAATWDLTIDTAQGTSQTTPTDTKTISIAFDAGDSLQRRAIPSPTLRTAEFIRVTAQNNQIDVYSQILGIRVYFHTRPWEGINVS